VNIYERVKRGDVDQCSFGFNILAEETDWRDDGTVKWTVTKIRPARGVGLHFPGLRRDRCPGAESPGGAHRERELEARRGQTEREVGGMLKQLMIAKKLETAKERIGCLAGGGTDPNHQGRGV